MNRNALRAIILLGGLWATAQAQAAASSAAFQDPAEAIKFYNKGLELRDAGKLQAAAESFKKAIEIDANFTEAHALLAEIYMRQERYADAIPAIERVLASRAEDDATLYNLGFVYWKANRFDESADALQRAIKVKPDSAQLYELLSHVYIRA
ncbi:MAG TPA: tetratricopeptide repeat protein, partial [Blastocatellia bacterium]|nr:tetratricopeptide repeat protein [Blastocatellia bacterium]